MNVESTTSTDRTPGDRSTADDRKAVVLLALLGALLLGFLAHRNAFVAGTHPAAVVHPGASGPSAGAIQADFPDHELPDGLGHDGQQFYAIARSPFELDEAAQHLDRPHYRLQRIAYPLTAAMLHPTGGGEGLVLAMFAVGVVAVFVGAAATGLLSIRLGGGPLTTLVFVLAPGAWFALRFSTADTYALAAALLALWLSLTGRLRWATVAAVVAVLAKESLILLPLGLFLHHRDREHLPLVAVPAAVAGAWWIALRALVTDHSEGVVEFTYPFGGLLSSARHWADGGAPFAMVAVLFSMTFAVLALIRAGRNHPLAPAIAIQLAFLTVLGHDVLALDANGTRMTMPLLILSTVTWASAAGAGSRRVAGDGQPLRTGPASAPDGGP